MEMNVGCIERFVRIFVGVVLVALTLDSDIGSWGYLGIVAVITGMSGMCPLTALLGINTHQCSHESNH